MTATLNPKELMCKYGDYISELQETLRPCDDMLLKSAEKFISYIYPKELNNTLYEKETFVTEYRAIDYLFRVYDDLGHDLGAVIETKDTMQLTDKGHCVFCWEGESPVIVGNTLL